MFKRGIFSAFAKNKGRTHGDAWEKGTRNRAATASRNKNHLILITAAMVVFEAIKRL